MSHYSLPVRSPCPTIYHHEFTILNSFQSLYGGLTRSRIQTSSVFGFLTPTHSHFKLPSLAAEHQKLEAHPGAHLQRLAVRS